MNATYTNRSKEYNFQRAIVGLLRYAFGQKVRAETLVQQPARVRKKKKLSRDRIKLTAGSSAAIQISHSSRSHWPLSALGGAPLRDVELELDLRVDPARGPALDDLRLLAFDEERERTIPMDLGSASYDSSPLQISSNVLEVQVPFGTRRDTTTHF